MAKYSEAVIEDIKNRLPVSEVVSQYVKLTRKGDRYWGLCPFHHEKTPSFTVLDSGGFYKCFGCGKGGSIFDFVMEMEHVSFPEAVEILAKKAGIELKEESEGEKRQYSKQKAIGELYDRLYKTYHTILLTHPQAQAARDYLAKRKVSADTIEKFQLGYAPDDPKWLYGFLRKNNYSDEVLKESGLFSRNYETLPLFRNRIMFPIRTWQGNCVAFGGRDLSGESRAKYINTPDTAIYSKRNVLFGFYESLSTIKEKKEITLCEGNFDVISLHQAGLTYAAAPLGTAFTEEQAKLIKRYCDRVNLLFDSDSAGQNATAKALLICQKLDLSNFVVKLEGAKDASQMLEEQGEQTLAKSAVNAVTGFSYLVSSALKMYDIRQPKGKSSVFKEVRPYLDATSSDIERQGYIKYLSDVLRIPEEKILSDYMKQRGTEPEPKEEEKATIGIAYNPLKASTELNAMLILMKNRDLFERFRTKVKVSDMVDPLARKLYTVLEDASRQDVRTPEILLQMIEQQELKDLTVTAFASPMYDRSNAEKVLEDAVLQIRLRRLEEKRNRVLRLLSSGEMENMDASEVGQYLSMKASLDKDIEELKEEMEHRE